jgi:predicted helicase
LAGDEYNAPQLIADNKIDAILDYALQFPKMVVFARYTAQVEKIRLALSKASYKVLTLTGQTKNRQEVLADANQSAECIIIIQSQISAGYELPDFPVMIFASLDYSIVNKIQAEGRILRINNLKKNLYITLVADSEIDQAVYKSIENKTDFAESIYLARMNE